ncbi:alpha/beta hydrolase [Flagellimonas algicola]|uniref:Alpha/beta hydrolase n=1 Tax=Flagellimonas algicola TaxID=2583815 RepID=A0ABY2WMF3_9FLAO|nr:alpha/beta hydrolase [Allomuricauda algicola]TMU56161.1 alpha/beta hydrolase [Allomuricauda algicola]
MKRLPITVLVSLFFLNGLVAQDTIIQLWPKGVPNQIDIGEKEVDTLENIRWVRNVQQPSIEVYLPSLPNNTGKAILLFPGGGYQGLAYNWEGVDFAKAFNSQGIVGIVVRYRLPNSKSIVKNRHEVPLQDAQRAIRLVRKMAPKWNIDPDEIGIMGFSAGGHLASTLGVHYDDKVYDNQDDADQLSARPDFMALVYPVITMDNEITHGGSREALLGKQSSDELMKHFSNELHVNANTPPTFLLHATDDEAVIVENSLRFYSSLKSHEVPVTMHIYPSGGHGFALGLNHTLLKGWLNGFIEWLSSMD